MTPTDRRSATEHEARVQQSLSHCWKEGIAAQVMVGIVDYFLVPFALLLGASTPEIGFLVSVPTLLASATQFAAVRAVHWAGGRLKLLALGFIVQAIFLMPIGLLSYLEISRKILILTALVTVYKSVGNLIGPAWGSLVSEYLPSHRRGLYFGWRARICGLAGLVNLAVWGVFLTEWKNHFSAEAGFIVLFMAAGFARLAALYHMSKMMDLPMQESRESEFTFWMFLRRFKESNFVKYVFYVSGITFATNLAAPYFSVHMLRDLHFSYFSYMAISIAPLLASLIAFPIWGRHADSVGNARILKITSFLIPVIPLLWLFPRSPLPLFIVELFAGFVWGGFNLCATNFIFDAVSPAKRVRCLGYFNMINGLALFGGAWLGGYLSARLPSFFGLPLLSLFALSAAVRFLANAFLSRQFKEVRAEAVNVTSARLFFSVVGIRPIFGRNDDMPMMAPKAELQFARRALPPPNTPAG